MNKVAGCLYSLVGTRHQHLVVAAHRIDHPFLNGGALRHFLVHDLEPLE